MSLQAIRAAIERQTAVQARAVEALEAQVEALQAQAEAWAELSAALKEGRRR
jgi:hypothetical protein